MKKDQAQQSLCVFETSTLTHNRLFHRKKRCFNSKEYIFVSQKAKFSCIALKKLQKGLVLGEKCVNDGSKRRILRN
jgi:hypothetical protein